MDRNELLATVQAKYSGGHTCPIELARLCPDCTLVTIVACSKFGNIVRYKVTRHVEDGKYHLALLHRSQPLNFIVITEEGVEVFTAKEFLDILTSMNKSRQGISGYLVFEGNVSEKVASASKCHSISGKVMGLCDLVWLG